MVEPSGFLKLKRYVLTTFGERDKVKGKQVNRDSFFKVIEGSKFKRKLKDGKLYGCFSHVARVKLEKVNNLSLPYEDILFESGKVCNVMYNIYTDVINGKERVVGEIGILDNNSGREVNSLFSTNSKLQVSMATRTSATQNEWIFQDILGVDFTTNPAFETQDLPISFSYNDSRSNLTYFSIQLDEIEGESKEVKGKSEEVGFSITGLREYLRERTQSPSQIMYKRLRAIIQYANGVDPLKLREDIPILVSYLRTFILDWINTGLENPSSKFNIMIALRLNRFVPNKKKSLDLQRALVRAKTNLSSMGTITKINQQKLNTAFGEVLHEIMHVYIKGKVKKEKHSAFENEDNKRTEGRVV